MKNTKMLVLIMLIIGFTAGLLTFWDTVTTFLIAALFAYMLNPLTNTAQKKLKIKRGLAVGLVLCAFLALLVILISTTAPTIIDQLSSLVSELHRYASNLDSVIDTLTGYMESLHLPPQVTDMVANLLAESDSYILSFVASLLTSAVSLSMQIFDLVIFIILMIYFMLDGPELLKKCIGVLPPSMGVKVGNLLNEADELTWKYIKSRCIVSGGMAVVTFIGLSLMGIKYAMLFAILSFFADFIPYFGSFIAGVIEAFYALVTGGFSLCIGVIVFVVVVQQIEGNIVAPKLQGESVGIHPITVMFALLVCNKIWGTIGMLISTPVAAVVKLVVREMYAYVISPDEPPAHTEES